MLCTFKPSRKTLLLTSTLLLLSSPALAQVGPNITPTGENVVAGAATFNRPAPNRLNVSQSTDRAIIEWDSFNIGRSATTEFVQPDVSSLAVNRVTGGNADPTQILGKLKANGRLMVLDPNGIIFGKDSVVDVGGIIASTGEVDDGAVTGGDSEFTFKNLGNGAIEARGKITVDDAGLVALVAPVMKHSGTVTAKMGRAELAAGETVTVDFYGDKLVEVALGQDDLRIENTGRFNVEGGAVTMSALTASQVVSSVINTTGFVDVSSVKVEGGKIILAAGTENDVTVGGKLFANGKDEGGEIKIGARDVNIAPNAQLTADSASGKGGSISVNADAAAIIKGRLRSSGATGGGDILIDTEGTIFADTARVESIARNSGAGGTIRVNAEGSNFDLAGRMYADGADGGGNIIVETADVNVGPTGRLSAQGTKNGTGGLIALNATNANKSGGRINVSGADGGGLVRLRGSSIEVTESIDARATESGQGGSVGFTLQPDGSALLSIADAVNASGIDGGGTIALSANPPGNPDNPLLKIHESGKLRAEALESGKGGTILLNAVDTDIQGDINASGAQGGGLVNLVGFETFVSGNIDAQATKSGSGGVINIDNEGDVTIIGHLDAGGANGGGKVKITGDDAFLQPESRIRVEAFKSGTGGDITVDTVGEIIAQGLLNADGRNGGGNIGLISEFVTLSGEATASATKAGNGGTVHLQGGSSNIFSGIIEAKGGPASGNGGAVTIDDPNTIAPGSVVDVSAPNGAGGTFNH